MVVSVVCRGGLEVYWMVSPAYRRMLPAVSIHCL